jgi:hypothetical protein
MGGKEQYMTTIKMAVLSFAFLAAAAVHSGRAGAEPGKAAEDPMAEAEHTADVAALSSSCPGVRIEHLPMTSGSTTYAFLDVYFDSSTGNNCAKTVSAGPAAGNASFIEVCLDRCTQTSPGSTCTADVEQCDRGAFHSFAGPVSVHAPGHCITAFGDLTFNNVFVSGELVGATHCF